MAHCALGWFSSFQSSTPKRLHRCIFRAHVIHRCAACPLPRSKLREAIRQAGAYAPSSVELLRRMAAAVNGNAHGMGATAGSNTDQGFGMFPVSRRALHYILVLF